MRLKGRRRGRDIDRPHQRPPRWTWAVAGIALGVALLYWVSHPHLERWTGLDLPTLNEWVAANSDELAAEPAGRAPPVESADHAAPAAGSARFPPDQVGNKRWESPGGLWYGTGPGGEHRIDHVLRHLKDDPQRDVHSVFTGDKYQVFSLIDEAYQMFLRGEPTAEFEQAGPRRRQVTVDMQRDIGYEGGRRGARDGFPRLTRLRLILDDDTFVVTAYPCR